MAPAKRTSPVHLYLLAQAAIIGGALAMDISGSTLPMALAGSLAIMLTAPLVRRLASARAARSHDD